MTPKLYLIGGVVVAVLLVVGLIYHKGQKAGGATVELKHERANNEATKRKVAVKPADSASTSGRLLEGSF